MTGVRLLMAISLVCPASVFAQTQCEFLNGPIPVSVAGKCWNVADYEWWKPLPNQAPSASRRDPMDHIRVDQFRIDRDGRPFKLDAKAVQPPTELQGEPGDDTTCYSIRSYVVARDSKYSDAVHPVSYTTCVPASRYRLRTTVGHATSEGESHLIPR